MTMTIEKSLEHDPYQEKGDIPKSSKLTSAIPDGFVKFF